MKPSRPSRLALLFLLLMPPAASAAVSSVSVPLEVGGLTASVTPVTDAATRERAERWFAALTPGWMPNRGQLASGTGPAREVLYSLQAPGGRLYVTGRGVTLLLSEGGEAEGERERTGASHETARAREQRWGGLEVELVGATIRADRALEEELRSELGEQNFYAPHCPGGVLGVPAYGRITFRDVYPGIDWVLDGRRGGPVHQDFVVHPGADPSRIRLRYRGARDLALDPARRTLTLRTALGEVSEGPLLCYQGSPADAVPARFRLAGDVVSLELGAWDRSAPLTVDPPLLWSTLYGGGDYDGPKSLYCDNRNGDLYIVGYTASANMPCSTAVAPLAYLDTTASAPPDAFIWKFDQLGRRRWATYYGGNNSDYATDCAVDRLGNLYVTGYTASTDFPTLNRPGAYWQPAPAGAIDGFLLRFNAQGVLQWATRYGGNGNDFASAVVTDSTDQVYMVGYGGSTNLNLVDPGSGAYYQPALDGGSDSFILKFDTLGALVWATYHGGDDGDQALGAVVNGNSLVVTGITFSTVFPTVDPPGTGDYFQGASNGQQEGFLSRFTLAGVQTWSTFYGGSGFDEPRRPVFTAAGDLYVAGVTNSTDLPVFNPNPLATPNQPAYFQAANAGQFDLFVLRFSATNARTWATYLGGSGGEDLGRGGRCIAADSFGRITLTGVSGSNDFPFANPGNGAYFQNTTSNSDVVYAGFTAQDSLEWSTFFGGSGGSFGTAVGFGVGDCLFGTGEFQNGNGFNTLPVNPPGLGAWFRASNAGSDDGFITRFCEKRSACCVELTCLPVATAAECAALGGTAFHPGQTCAQVSCSVLCTICGRKFSDLDRDGVQDPGEPSLPGWTIELHYPGGGVYASAVTDANGDYCFNGVPCGPWLVTESAQSGWVQVAPASAGHDLSLPLATTQGGVDFGNYSCPAAPPCSPVPPGLAAWWPFDDGPGATSAADVTHAASGENGALLPPGAAGGAGFACFGGTTGAALVPAVKQAGLEFGAGSFGIMAWVNPDASSTAGRVLAQKLGGGSAGGLAGWSLELDGMQCVLRLAAGGAPQVVAGPLLPPGAWSHVAVSVDRASGEGRWYVDGAPSASGPFVPVAGSLANTADVAIGGTDPALGTGPGLGGCLAQLALFHTPISPDIAAKAYGVGPGSGVPLPWCPDVALIPASRTLCSTQNTVTVCFQLANNGAAPATYSWSLAGLPVGPGCTFAGPTQFSPSAGSVTVAAGGVSAPICVTITRPAGFTQQGATSCFSLTFVNHATGVCRSRTSTLRVDNSCWCASPVTAGLAPVPAAGRVVPFSIARPCDPVTSLPYRVVAHPEDPGLPAGLWPSLEGAAPGAPFASVLAAGETTLPVHVYFPGGYDFASRFELALEADTDGDGTFETLTSAYVAPAAGGSGTTGVPGGAPVMRAGLVPGPNPFVQATTLAFTVAGTEPVALEIHDLSGRLVRSLVRGWLPPGPRLVTWDGRDDGGRRLPPGVYLARLRTRSGTLESRVVKVQ